MSWTGHPSSPVNANTPGTLPDGDTPGTLPDGEKPAVEPAPAGPLPRSVGALLRLLELTGAAGPPGWRRLLYACLLHALQTAAAYQTTAWSLRYGLQKLAAGVPAVRVVADTAFFGVAFVLRWLTLSAVLLRGRRHFSAELDRVRACLDQLSDLPGWAAPRRRTARIAAALLAVMLALTVGIGWTTEGFISPEICRSQHWSKCLLAWTRRVGYVGLVVSFQLVPVKFLLVGLLISDGLETVNAELRAMVNGERPAGAWQLQRLARLRARLTDSFVRLTGDSAAELVLAMANGMLLQVTLFMSVLETLRSAFTAQDVAGFAVYLMSTGLTLSGPCEAGQRALQLSADSRRLLLQLEGRRPELASQAALLREAAAQDLDTLGDLGLFRLRRSTIVSASSTILTYVIIMVQFSEAGGGGRDAAAAGSVSVTTAALP
ncbi:hypothetical protein FJT64_005825 [Amphibalanus amphitrite]|uniref:Gustatory receptor n=1 Tax=Amphibalanus amphitrite TaxID=1232801 RepID=A0A6A4VST8_AMPAM|nr:hypothetical protein FJT64_005825 [Amphibalanus amphitrite]